MTSLQDAVQRIGPLLEEAMAAARARQDQLTKPQGSLGRLESLSVQVAGITGNPRPVIHHKAVIVVAGDHGVAAEGVSAYPQEVTAQMVYNFLRGGAAINVLARHVDARVVVVDAGVAADLEPHPALKIRKIGYGAGNIARGPAMTREQAVQALETGIALVEEELSQGLDIVAPGDMGIANTTPAAAIAAAVTGLPPAEVTGRGTGVDDAGLARKIAVVEQALRVNEPDPKDGVDLLAKVGGFEIGVIAGIILGAAAHRIPAVLDGFICTAGALIAAAIAPAVTAYCIAGHNSLERGHSAMLRHLGLKPLLDLDMRLGEGTGAVLAMGLVEAACKILNEMATFAEAGVSERTG
ncbi:MAG: nicotinate-nucleotide--dimethylbenzimidazole phosphoribosyltransferase [Anaerolineae bacterium]|nr:nicotinate-nucleotide--dimethylbenzimidazole phosphoribosyltransferase [Anaerolineae bacterium]MDW8067601.1 nicotinate-nucleotide--dimethylbenzimidazole phosphoribosyltransferase [Anaerolineae bacterium]